MVKYVLVACGTSIATATVVATKIKELLRKNKIQTQIFQCKSFEVKSKVGSMNYDLIVSTTKVSGEKEVEGKRFIPGKSKEVPILNGIPYLTGRNMDELDNQVLDALKET